MSRSIRLSSERHLAEQVLQHHMAIQGRLSWVAKGHSMWPWIVSNLRLTVTRADAAELCKGDVVLFSRRGGFGLHRVISITPYGVITRGDAHDLPGHEIMFSQVIGKVEGFVLGPWVWTGAPKWFARLTQYVVLYSAPRMRSLIRRAQGWRMRLKA